MLGRNSTNLAVYIKIRRTAELYWPKFGVRGELVDEGLLCMVCGWRGFTISKLHSMA